MNSIPDGWVWIGGVVYILVGAISAESHDITVTDSKTKTHTIRHIT